MEILPGTVIFLIRRHRKGYKPDQADAGIPMSTILFSELVLHAFGEVGMAGGNQWSP
jgi:hypothetical protein